MYKRILLTLALFPLITGAKPVIKENPTLRADLRLVTRDGTPIYTFAYENNKLTQFQNKDKVTSFLYEERKGAPCPPGAYCLVGEIYRALRFSDVKVGKDKCGSLKYTATSLENKAKLLVVDHRTRKCDDYKQDRWEVTLIEGLHAYRYFRGNPESVAQTDCERYVRNTICTMQYMPVNCSVQSVNWDAVTPAISAQGSNACFATSELKKKVCERSYNADKIQEDEIVCVPSKE